MKKVTVRRHYFNTLLALFLTTQSVAIAEQFEKANPKSPSSSKRLLSKEHATAYAIELVNRDRAKFGIKPVLNDEIAALAGQKHADEMAMHGYLSHWDLYGKKPIQRYTECGGTDSASENVGLITLHPSKIPASKAIFQLKENYRFLSTDLEDLEKDFMNEKPPDDGHRLQILDSSHNKLGIGLAYAEVGGQGRLTIAQEFVNQYGEFEKIPTSLNANTTLQISGSLPEQIKIEEVKIELEPLPQPHTIAQLDSGLKTSSNEGLPIREFLAGKDSQLKLWISGAKNNFSVNVQIDDKWEPGLYYITIWAKKTTDKKLMLISARTALLN